MCRKVKEFIELEDYTSLDVLIERLTAIRANLPADAEPELKLRGDDIFGRTIGISFLRSQTAEEVECDARYAGDLRQGCAATDMIAPRATALLAALRFRSAA